MKNNTIAIALASLLVGGVATAGYMNSRDAAGRGNDTVPHAVDAAVPAAADRAAAGDVLPDAPSRRPAASSMPRSWLSSRYSNARRCMPA